jgi:PTS system fructose IIA component.
MGKIIIVSGHGHYATGVQSSVELLAGKNSDFFYVDFTETDSDQMLKEKFESILERNPDREVLFVCDILGGTPFRVAAEISGFSDHMEVVAGCNISGLIEISLMKDSVPLGQLADYMVEVSKNSTIRLVKDSLMEEPMRELDDGEGI